MNRVAKRIDSMQFQQMVLICCLEYRDESHDDVTSKNGLDFADN